MSQFEGIVPSGQWEFQGAGHLRQRIVGDFWIGGERVQVDDRLVTGIDGRERRVSVKELREGAGTVRVVDSGIGSPMCAGRNYVLRANKKQFCSLFRWFPVETGE